jgi:fused signal recognition particle receptor
MAFSFFKKKDNTASKEEGKQEVSVQIDTAEVLPVSSDPVQISPESESAPDLPPSIQAPIDTDTALVILSDHVPPSVADTPTPKKLSWAQRLKSGLSKTRDTFSKKLVGVFGGGKIDENLYEELETILLSSDIGISATNELLDRIRNKVRLKDLKDGAQLKLTLQESITELLLPIEKPLQVEGHKPFVIMLVGVNGAGKTTSIGKLAKYFQDQGKSILLAAGDTFRAAAREQLIELGSRNNVTVISQAGGDSAAVCFDAIQSAIANKIDIVIADTAGRLPTQLNLMEEIKKVKRVIGKALDGAPHEVLLVLDSNIGQNALNQVRAFDDALNLSGLVLTKLDGTAKGGIICAIARERPIPLRFIGVGETIDDLRPFNAADYARALFE